MSKRQVSADEIVQCEEKYANAKTVNQILRRVAEAMDFTSDEQLEELFQKTAWHFDRKYSRKGASFDVFKQAITYAKDSCLNILLNRFS